MLLQGKRFYLADLWCS